MITKDSGGTTLPAAYATTLTDDNRQWLSKLSVNGTELDGAIVRWSLVKGSSGGAQFTCGAVMSSVITIIMRDLTTSVKDQDIKVEIALNVSGSYKYITLGYFTATEVKKTHYQTEITAYGHSVSKTGDILSMSNTQTLANIKNAISSATGVSVTLDNAIDSTLTIDKDLAGLTTYQVLQVLASVVGGYVMDEADGSISVRKYGTTSSLSVGTDRMVKLPDVAEQNFTITGVEVTVGDTVISSSGTVNLQTENPYMTQTLFIDEFEDLVGYSYRPATIDLSKGDPRLEGNDVVTVTDIGGATYTVPCHQVTHTYDGGLATQIMSIRATMTNNLEGTAAPITSRLKEQEKQIVEVSNIASNTNQYFWFTGTGTDTGAHITEVPQDEFTDSTSPNYHNGGNLLARSNGIAVRDGMTELATFGATGAQIGVSSGGHTTIQASGMKVYGNNGSDELANIGYGSGNNSSGGTTNAPYFSLGERRSGIAVGNYSVAEGLNNTASGYCSHAEGNETTASGHRSHAEGGSTTINSVNYSVLASGAYAHAEGGGTTASASYAHAEGGGTTASASGTHAEGYLTTASDLYAHAEGYKTTASGQDSHAEGDTTTASGSGGSHAEGRSTVASGTSSHAQNEGTVAQGAAQTALGKYNVAGGIYTDAVIVGGGVDANNRKNIANLQWTGDLLLKGDVYVGCNDDSTGGTKLTSGGAVSGVKGDAESTYRTGNVNITAANVGAVPTSRTVNNKALSSNITLTASDVSALPISGGTLSGGDQIFNCRIANSSSRETTASPTVTGHRGITSFLSSGTMTTDRPPSSTGTGTGEGTIIHCEWDNTGGWNSQLFVADNDSNNGKPFVAVRGQRSGTWTNWDILMARSDMSDWVITQGSSATSYGDGYWRWREWYSGKVEIWYHGTFTLTTADSQTSGVYRESRWFNFPNNYSLYKCACLVNGMDAGSWFGCGGLQNSSSQVAEPYRKFQVMVYRISGQPPAATNNVNVYICGEKNAS